MANTNLGAAKAARNDEFYTQYPDIEREVNAYLEYDPDVFRGKTILLPCDDPEWSNFTKYFAQNFDRFGLRRLVSTSFAPDSKRYSFTYEPTLFETLDPRFDEDMTKTRGKIFVLDKDRTGDGRIDVNDLEWEYLEGDGDFRSDEVKRLRDEADFIITNPPFSLFREFLAWIIEADKRFLIIGNMNAICYKEAFPLIKDNKMWYGCSITGGDREFRVPDEYPLDAAGWRIDENGKKYKIIDHMLNIIRTHRALAVARSLYALVSCFRVRHADPLPFFDYVVSRITHATNTANAIAARIRSPSPA